MTQSHLNAPAGALITTLPDPTELPAAITVARRMLATFSTVDHGDRTAVDHAHSALAESLRILVRAIDRTAREQQYAAANETADQPAAEPVGPGCGAPATARIEGYSARDGRAHGSLDRVVYACVEHTAQARADWLDDLLPYSMPVAGTAVCGQHYDHRAMGGGQ
ncbi:hypothetical protein ABZS88_11335 [Streptomyces sp. NPDC005480]|uniref:hypothetical protein n=1 Tax=Streptomyces sp. NPDC005480 TaxID=3154880 RepID=UPI0033BC6229